MANHDLLQNVCIFSLFLLSSSSLLSFKKNPNPSLPYSTTWSVAYVVIQRRRMRRGPVKANPARSDYGEIRLQRLKRAAATGIATTLAVDLAADSSSSSRFSLSLVVVFSLVIVGSRRLCRRWNLPDLAVAANHVVLQGEG